jgi:fluoroacetyl-CoA thioesterase
VTVDQVEGRRVRFSVQAHDGIEPIGGGTHERFIIDPARFLARVRQKASGSA